MISIQLVLNAGEKMCDDCQYLTIFHTGLKDEFHPTCEIFPEQYGEWGARNMRRPRVCLKAEKNARHTAASGETSKEKA